MRVKIIFYNTGRKTGSKKSLVEALIEQVRDAENKIQAVSFLQNDSEKKKKILALSLSKQSSETEPNTKLVLKAI